MENCISINDGVVLCKGTSLKYIRARPGKKERMDNFNVFADDLIGNPFGAAYKVNGRQLIRIDVKELDEEQGGRNDEKARDNRSIVDDCSAQKMSRDDIMDLKEAGKDGDEIVGRIIDNSATFKEKTAYSQAKYLKKKKKKHLAHFITHRPSSRLLCQLFFTSSAPKILEMRPDTLAQILTWSNVRSGAKVLLAETCQGLLLGSILERLGNAGQIVQAFPGNFPVRIILDKFNISERVKSDLICGFSLDRLEELKQGPCSKDADQAPPISNDAGTDREELDLNGSTKIENDAKMITENDEVPQDVVPEKAKTKPVDQEQIPCDALYTKEKRLAEESRAMPYLKARSFNSLIIASKFHPKNLMIELFEYLQPSSPLIIYCQYQEPLIECYEYLRAGSLAVNVFITDTWFRDIQVLPNRTHPGITMSARGGYVLRAIKVKKGDNFKSNDDDQEPDMKKQKVE